MMDSGFEKGSDGGEKKKRGRPRKYPPKLVPEGRNGGAEGGGKTKRGRRRKNPQPQVPVTVPEEGQETESQASSAGENIKMIKAPTFISSMKGLRLQEDSLQLENQIPPLPSSSNAATATPGPSNMCTPGPSTVSASLPPPPRPLKAHEPRHPVASTDVPKTFWSDYLDTLKNAEWVAPVDAFHYSPFAKKWAEFAQLGLKMELPNPVVKSKLPVFWYATIVYGAGYKVVVEFDKLDESSDDSDPIRMWIPFCTGVPKPIGYARQNKFLLFPTSPKDQADPQFFSKAVAKIKENTGKTLSPDHISLVKTALAETRTRFKLNEIVEALDKSDCSVIRMARVTALFGDRVHVCYFGLQADDQGFWFNQHSHYIHKFGFCHAINASLAWSGIKLVFPRVAPSELLSVPRGTVIPANSMFEMRHPVLTHKIVAAIIIQVYKHGYFKASTDWTKKEEVVEILMHISSDYVLPLNFCRDNRVDFQAPVLVEEKRKSFSWKELMDEEFPECKPLDLSRVTRPDNPFLVGAKLEAVMISDTAYLGPATVTKVAGHLLLIHFDGFSRNDDTSYQWVSCQSSMIYPVGYAELIGHKLSGCPEEPNIAETMTGVKLKIKKHSS